MGYKGYKVRRINTLEYELLVTLLINSLTLKIPNKKLQANNGKNKKEVKIRKNLQKKVSSNSNRIMDINYRRKYKYAYHLLTTFADPS